MFWAKIYAITRFVKWGWTKEERKAKKLHKRQQEEYEKSKQIPNLMTGKFDKTMMPRKRWFK